MLIWTETAKIDVINFINNSYSKASTKKYFNNLTFYLENLVHIKNLGKTIHVNYDSSVIKLLIYKKHKIYYLIRDYDIYILTILHSKMNPYNIKKRLSEFID